MFTKTKKYVPPPGSPQPTVGIRGHHATKDHLVQVKPHTRHTKYGTIRVAGYTKTQKAT